MSQEAVERFLGRIITDGEFRNRAMASLESTCVEAGLLLSAEEVACLKRLNYRHFRKLAEEVDDSLCRG